MRYELKITLASLLIVFMAVQIYGNTPADSVKVYFRAGYSCFDPALDENRNAMENFISLVRKKYEADLIDSVVVRAYTSPEGTNESNERLSQLRCEKIADLIVKETNINPQMIHKIPEGVAWNELRRVVAGNIEVPSREKVLYILDNVPLWIRDSKGVIIDGKKKRLMDLDNGETFRWLSVHVFPQLRNAVAIALYVRPTVAIPELSPVEPLQLKISVLAEVPDMYGPTVLPYLSDMTVQQSTVSAPAIKKEPRHFYMDVKTDLLYDAVLVPNLGAEFFLGKNLSFYGEWMYAWWDNENRHRSWRIYGGDVGLRWWLGRKAHAKPLSGHHLGIYAGILTFDFATGDRGYLGGKPKGTLWDRHLINAGMEYGYSLPVAKRLNIDFSIGLGYLGGHYIKYFPFDNDLYREKEINLRFFGPTKAEISLVWLIGRGNVNDRKGGER